MLLCCAGTIPCSWRHSCASLGPNAGGSSRACCDHEEGRTLRSWSSSRPRSRSKMQQGARCQTISSSSSSTITWTASMAAGVQLGPLVVGPGAAAVAGGAAGGAAVPAMCPVLLLILMMMTEISFTQVLMLQPAHGKRSSD